MRKVCKCQHKVKEVPCNQALTCEFKCLKLRKCGRHACKKKVFLKNNFNYLIMVTTTMRINDDMNYINSVVVAIAHHVNRFAIEY